MFDAALTTGFNIIRPEFAFVDLNYHITGVVSVFFFLLCLIGIGEQLREILRRKRDVQSQSSIDSQATELERPTAILSLNQFFASFLAFYSFFVYGICVEPLDHYLIWTRLFATLLVLRILWEIRVDRQSASSKWSFAVGVILMLSAIALGLSGQRFAAAKWVSAALAIFAAAVFAQGLTHQILWIRRIGHTGAVSLRMHQLTTCKDASTLAFASAMGFSKGWPLMVVAIVGIAVKSVLMWHFRWVRITPIAARRRDGVPENTNPHETHEPNE